MRALRQLHPLDWIALGLLTCGILCVATGLLQPDPTHEVLDRTAPLVPFLGTVIVLAELTSRAEVFDVLASWVARLAGGSYAALFLMCVAFATLVTVTLNLDTTAVLLTPVMLALAIRCGIAPLPLAMTTVWLANTASLLLPVSNLTNLLAADRVALASLEMARVMWAPELASVAATMACLWAFYWRRGRRDADRYIPPPRITPADPVLFRACAVACAGFLVAVLLGDFPLWIASAGATAAAVSVFALRRRSELRWSLVPWRLLAFVPGMFLVVATISEHGLERLLTSAIGTDGGAGGLARAGLTGTVLSNAINNLPAYLAGEAAVPVGNHDQLLALLIGTNAGPLFTPWASLATLLWFERCRVQGVRVPLGRFTATSALVAVGAVTAAVTALALT